jgi:hypothetical protein
MAEIKPQILPRVLKLDAGLLETQGSQGLTFTILSWTNPDLFAAPPRALPDGSLNITIFPKITGESAMRVRLVQESRVRPGVLLSPFERDILMSIINVNSPPSYKIKASYVCAEDGGPQTVEKFAYEISVGPPDEQGKQRVYFNVSIVTSPELLARPPMIDENGTLQFTPAEGKHGSAVARVQIFDDGGTFNGGINYDIAGPRMFEIKVLPKPRIQYVTPRVGPVEGGYDVTLTGAFFGSKYSRGYSVPVYGNLSVTFGEKPCQNVRFISDAQVVCEVPDGMGYAEVRVAIEDGRLSRTGATARAFSHALLYYAGVGSDGSGFLAQGPDPSYPGDLIVPSATVRAIDVSITRGVLALVAYRGTIYGGGSFDRDRSSGTVLNNVMEWRGGAPIALGTGVDGTVNALAVYDGQLVVGGSFNRAMQPRSVGGSLRCGGLAAWDGRAWSLVGDGVVEGLITALTANSSVLYVAGTFRRRASDFGGIAAWDGVEWKRLGSGVEGGAVNVMFVASENLYVGGSFTRAGGVAASHVAKWDSREWVSMGAVNGQVCVCASVMCNVCRMLWCKCVFLSERSSPFL